MKVFVILVLAVCVIFAGLLFGMLINDAMIDEMQEEEWKRWKEKHGK